MAAALDKTSPAYLPQPGACCVNDLTCVQMLAAKTDETIARFRRWGLFQKYCGPFTVHNYLHLSGSPVSIDSVLRHFNICDVNRGGSHAEKLKAAIAACSFRVPVESESLSSREIDRILLKGSPIAVLLKGDGENHWVTLVGSDDLHYLVLDYNQIRRLEKVDFKRLCMKLLYFPISFMKRRGIEFSTETPFLVSRPLKLHRRKGV